jgi:outer membrane lipoprotein-sorting protein
VKLRFSLIFLLFLSFFAKKGIAQQTEDAVAIVRKADERARGKTSVAEMTITTVRPKWTRSMDIKAWTKGNDLALILVKSPAKDKGTSFLKRKKEVWNWLPSLERTIKLPPSMMSQSWMGTDFTNDDLVKESSIVEDYEHKLLGSEKQGDRDCYKIELVPKPEAAVVWGKIIAWIDKKDYNQIRTEFYDENGELSQTMIGSELKMLGGRLLPSRIEMTPAGKKGHKTEIVYKSLEFDKPLADSFFTTENMTKIK